MSWLVLIVTVVLITLVMRNRTTAYLELLDQLEEVLPRWQFILLIIANCVLITLVVSAYVVVAFIVGFLLS